MRDFSECSRLSRPFWRSILLQIHNAYLAPQGRVINSVTDATVLDEWMSQNLGGFIVAAEPFLRRLSPLKCEGLMITLPVRNPFPPSPGTLQPPSHLCYESPHSDEPSHVSVEATAACGRQLGVYHSQCEYQTRALTLTA